MTQIVSSRGAWKYLWLPSADWADRYDRVSLWRSDVADGGPYIQLMGDGWDFAQTSLTYQDADVTGLTLEVLVDGSITVSVTFTSNDKDQIIADILEQGAPYIEVVDEYLRVKALGMAHSISVVYSEASVALELDAETVNYGMDPKIRLVSGTEIYPFLDPYCLATSYYKIRYHKGETSSSLSAPISSAPVASADPSRLIVGEITLYDVSGIPISNRLVKVFYDGNTVSNTDILPSEVGKLTDAAGYTFFTLLKGAVVTVSIEGTSAFRKIQIPSTGDTFSLTDPSISYGDDVWKVQVPQIQVGERRSI